MNDIPKVISTGSLKLGSVTIDVLVLDNGKRVVTEEGMKSFMQWLQGGGQANEEEIQEFAKAIKGF